MSTRLLTGPAVAAAVLALAACTGGGSAEDPSTAAGATTQTTAETETPTEVEEPQETSQEEAVEESSLEPGEEVPEGMDLHDVKVFQVAIPSGWTLEQKVSACTGTSAFGNRCTGTIGPVGDSWPGLCLEDGPLGVRSTDFITAFPAGINAAATWNRPLIRARGQAIGQEFKGKGVNIGLGPMMNIAKVPQAGRNWEGFGADPFLSGEAVYETVLG